VAEGLRLPVLSEQLGIMWLRGSACQFLSEQLGIMCLRVSACQFLSEQLGIMWLRGPDLGLCECHSRKEKASNISAPVLCTSTRFYVLVIPQDSFAIVNHLITFNH